MDTHVATIQPRKSVWSFVRKAYRYWASVVFLEAAKIILIIIKIHVTTYPARRLESRKAAPHVSM